MISVLEHAPVRGVIAPELQSLLQRVQDDAARYARPPAQWERTQAPLLWITGLAGSGKSTLARALQTRLRETGEVVRRIDGDDVRAALDRPDLADLHGLEHRRGRAQRLLRLAHASALQGGTTVVATISLQAEVHAALRASHACLGVVVLQAPWPLLRQRRPDLYSSAERAAQVVGLGQAAQWPLAPAQVLSAQESLDAQLQRTLALWRSLRAAA